MIVVQKCKCLRRQKCVCELVIYTNFQDFQHFKVDPVLKIDAKFSWFFLLSVYTILNYILLNLPGKFTRTFLQIKCKKYCKRTKQGRVFTFS